MRINIKHILRICLAMIHLYCGNCSNFKELCRLKFCRFYNANKVNFLQFSLIFSKFQE